MDGQPADILSLLRIVPSPQSADYVRNKRPFQLHTLLTEQRHSRTWNLSFSLKQSVEEGLRQILSVDEDISSKLAQMAEDPTDLLQAAQAVRQALRSGRKVFIYGCGATGRLAKQMESAVWRPFWNRVKTSPLWEKCAAFLSPDIETRLTGEMTGGDRALISSLEGFEDLQRVGKLQVLDRGVQRGDVVFCITEGGETSSVIGAILAALNQYGKMTREKTEEAKQRLYFLYNNPDELLRPYDRSRSVIDNPAITKINLTTGPQAVTGSTRMQAATIETYIMGLILETGIYGILDEFLDDHELAQLGFPQEPQLRERLIDFNRKIREPLLHATKRLARLTRRESQVYQNSRYTTYFAKSALITVFIDCAERSPTFHLSPLDTVQEEHRKCWLQVWTEAEDFRQAWCNFLGRKFRGLEESFYKPDLSTKIEDIYLREAALRSLAGAGRDQERQYDFSFSENNIKRSGPQEGDLGVLVALGKEIEELADPFSSAGRFARLFKQKKASLALILVSGDTAQKEEDFARRFPFLDDQDIIIACEVDRTRDPLRLNRQVLLKVLLNAHSTAVMARMGRIVGNTMTNVSPSNLKLIGRATSLIQSHVNDTLSQPEWVHKHGPKQLLTYAQANAVLFEAMDFVAEQGGQTSEVALSILRILEASRQNRFLSWQEALRTAQDPGLEAYLEAHNPSLRRSDENPTGLIRTQKVT